MAQTKKKPSFIKRIFKLFFFTTLFVIVGVGVAGTFVYFNAAKDLPKLDHIEDYTPPVMSEVFSENGQKVGEFWIEARILTPIDKIPKKLIQAFVSSEDDRFFEHSGVDLYSIVRAFIRNFQAGHVVEGGSTITQQLTKGLLLSPERTYDRKVKEAILATRIEKNLSKEQILYLYLNQIYFGNRSYGIAAAARNYFHKDLSELNLAEISMIVGLSKGPSKFNPIRNPARAISRQQYVINRMLEESYITEKEATEAKEFKLTIYKAGLDKDYNKKFAPYFVEHVRRHLMETYGYDKLYKGGWKIYTTLDLETYNQAQHAVREGLLQLDKRYGYRGSLKSLETKEAADKFLLEQYIRIMDKESKINYFGFKGYKDAFENLPIFLRKNTFYQAVVLENLAGGYRVQIGNKKVTISSGNSQLVRSKPPKPYDVIYVEIQSKKEKGKAKDTSVAQGVNQFVIVQKPSIQAALYSYEPYSGKLRANIGGFSYDKDEEDDSKRYDEFNRSTQSLRQPGSTIKPFIYSAGLDKGYTPNTVIMDSPIRYEESPGKFWIPKNYGGRYYGPTLLRNALINSRNVVTVRILMDIGTHYAAAYLRKMGLTTPIFKYYSLGLGATEVKLSELARAYGVFATGGVLPEVYFIKSIEDPNGKIIEEHIDDPNRFIVRWDQEQSQEKEKPENKSEKNSVSSVTIKHKRSYDEMDWNKTLLDDGEKETEKDDIHISEYERKVLYGDYIPKGHVISPNTAVTMNSLLQDVIRYGTGVRARALGRPAGGKTGTTNGATDAWFMGFVPQLVTGVWVGFDKKIQSIGRGATGGGIALPIWLAYMQEAVKKYPVMDFKVPKWIDLSQYSTPIQVVGIGDAELGDIGVGTGVDVGGGSPGSGSSANFFSQDLDW